VVPTDEIEEQAAEDAIGRLDDAMMVREGLSRLGPECQEILDRFFGRDESYRTIGEALDIPAGTIASRISRCLGRLRTEVER
jgi:RNA polymerase sigma factor (sigma-70 family)